MTTASAATHWDNDNAAAQLKEQHHAVWASGDYASIAELIDEVPPEHLLARIGIAPGHEVLDVATGTGNVALRAAKAGARVTGLDLTPELFETARRRASEWNVEVDWVEGDAEDLPFADGGFDRVLSSFGVQFAPRHQVTARELVRVTRPGGAIGLVSWTPGGQVGRMLGIIGRYLPAPPAFASPPPKWGDETHVRRLFATVDPRIELELERGTNPWFFESADEFVSFFETRYGPMLKAREKLSPTGTWETCRTEIVSLLDELNLATDGTLHVEAEYLLAIAHVPE